MSLSLGLDLGSNSIGWGIVDLNNKEIVDCGVRIFHEGVNRDNKGKEIPKNAARREFRQARRQHRRRKLRLKMIIKVLQEKNMMPLNNNDFQEWYKLNPYFFRFIGLDKKLTLLEFGRILFQFAKRRGFKSTRKGEAKETKIDETDKNTGKIGIKDNDAILENGYRTLGEYFYSIMHKDGDSYISRERIRNRIIKRQNYIDEFNLLWDKQCQYYPDLLIENLKNEIGDPKKGILFFQRELISQKKLVGRCILEKNRPRCPINRIEFEEFRTWQFINNIQINGEPLKEQLRLGFYDYVAGNAKDTTISELINKFKLNNDKLNYDDETKIPMHYTKQQFNKLLGKDYTKNLSDNEIEMLKDNIRNILIFAKNDEWLKKYAVEKWNFSEQQLETLCKINLKDGYSTLSLKAINNILPFLKVGYKYYEAVLLAGVYNAMGDLINEIADEEIERLISNIRIIINSNNPQGETIVRIKEYLAYNFNLDDNKLKKLYHPSQIEVKKAENNKLRMPDNVRNPIVQKGLFELRKLVIALLDKYKSFDRINIELARDIKITKKEKIKIYQNNRENEKFNNEAREYIKQWGLKESRENIHKYLLYKELEKEGKVICPYSHKTISLTQLFDDSNVFQIEHIIPYSVSLDDSLANKTLCDSMVNQAKGDQTPYEYFGGDEERWKIIKDAAFKILPYKKARKFTNEKTMTFEDFASKQLNDTRYFSKYASEYLKQICPIVSPYAGGITAKLRHHWGLNSILNLEDETKNRDDNRHHTIDALVVAVTDKKVLFRMSNIEKFKYVKKHLFPEPWEGFRDDMEEAVSSILVSFENRNKILTPIITKKKKKGIVYTTKGYSVRGSLHAETVYGKRRSPVDGQDYYNVRVYIDSIDKEAKVRRIADPEIKRIVEARLRQMGVDTDVKKYTVPKGAFTKINNETGLKQSLIFVQNKNGDPVPINKVRLKNESSNATQLHSGINQYVEPSNNYMVAIYETENGTYFEEIISFWEAVERKSLDVEIAPKEIDGAKLIQTLTKNDMFILNMNDNDIHWDYPDYKILFENLYRVQKFSSVYYVFRKHTASTILNDNEMISIRSMSSFKNANPIKVKIDIKGKICKA